MEKAILIFLVLFSEQMQALHIRDVVVSVNATKSINVSVNTEASELYYFHAAQYTISGNTITVEACYVSGFGSTIEFLNNNFEIPIDTEQTANYALTVKIYYTDLQVFYEEQNLQDEITGMFSTPFSGQIVLEDNRFEKKSQILFPNPVKDYLLFSRAVNAISIYDTTGRIIRRFWGITNCVDLSEIASGIYFIEYFDEQQSKKTIVKE